MSVNMLTQSKKRMFEKNKEEYTKTNFDIYNQKCKSRKKSIFKNIKFKIYVDHNSTENQVNGMRDILKNPILILRF